MSILDTHDKSPRGRAFGVPNHYIESCATEELTDHRLLAAFSYSSRSHEECEATLSLAHKMDMLLHKIVLIH